MYFYGLVFYYNIKLVPLCASRTTFVTGYEPSALKQTPHIVDHSLAHIVDQPSFPLSPLSFPATMTGIQHNAEHDARRAHLMKIDDRGNTNNYHYWASCTMDKLEQLDLWKFISGPESTPPIVPTLVKHPLVKV